MDREETSIDRNAKCDVRILMEDANDFSWQSERLHMQYYSVGWRRGK